MRTAIALILLFGCERAKSEPQAPKPVAVKIEAAAAPIPKKQIEPEEVVRPAPPERHDGLPNPPTDEPVAYKAWFDALPRTTQRKINSVCRKEPTAYQYICGGIGHLHIPYPPFIRARVRDEHDPKLYFESDEAWTNSLTVAQKRYIDRHCPRSEWGPESSDLCGDNTPLVLSFDSAPIQFTAGGTFAFAPGIPNRTDWPTSPWLVLDRDGDGAITSGAELFGDQTPGGARSAFGALRLLDANGDDVIDANDPAFAQLQLWTDDGDQRTAASELSPLADRVVSISLANRRVSRCDARDNCEGDRAEIIWRAADGTRHTGAIVDVYLPVR